MNYRGSYEIAYSLPPSDNAAYRSGFFRGPGGQKMFTGRRHLASSGRKFKEELGYLLIRQKVPSYSARERGKDRPVWAVSGRVEIPKGEIWRSDLTNRFKLSLDVIAKHIGIDDRYIVRAGPFVKVIGGHEPGMVLRIDIFDSFEQFLEGGEP